MPDEWEPPEEGDTEQGEGQQKNRSCLEIEAVPVKGIGFHGDEDCVDLSYVVRNVHDPAYPETGRGGRMCKQSRGNRGKSVGDAAVFLGEHGRAHGIPERDVRRRAEGIDRSRQRSGLFHHRVGNGCITDGFRVQCLQVHGDRKFPGVGRNKLFPVPVLEIGADNTQSAVAFCAEKRSRQNAPVLRRTVGEPDDDAEPDASQQEKIQQKPAYGFKIQVRFEKCHGDEPRVSPL